MSVHQNRLTDRIHIRIKALGKIRSNDSHRSASSVFLVGEKSTLVHVNLAFFRVRFLDTQKVQAVSLVSFIFGALGIRINNEHGRYLVTRIALVTNVDGICIRQVFARTLLAGQIACTRAHRELKNDDRVRTKTPQNASDSSIETSQDRSDSDDCPGSHDNSQHGQQGAHFVCSYGLECERCRIEDSQPVHLLLRSERFDGIELRGLACRIDSKEQSNCGRESDSNHNSRERKSHRD